MMSVLHKEEGANLRIEILQEPGVQSFIESHAAALDHSMQSAQLSPVMRERLSKSNYVFSGIKTFHELNEAFPSLLDDNGNRKPFEQFLNDVQSIDKTYNGNYLRAEYNFVNASAEMAAKWEQFQQDGDRYNLQYRTANDGKVRPEHAELHGVTLPPSDPFWSVYYPPNGWNCRCTVVQVRKAKYPTTDHTEAMERGEKALSRDKKGMFRFNPGIQGKSFPDYNPYTISRCRDCDIASKLAKVKVGVLDNELCQACQLIRLCQSKFSDLIGEKEILTSLRKQAMKDMKEMNVRPTVIQSESIVHHGKLYFGKDDRENIIKHCKRICEFDLVKSLDSHLRNIEYVTREDIHEKEDKPGQKEKKQARGVIEYTIYKLTVGNDEFELKCEVILKDHKINEHPYFLKLKKK